MNDGKFDGGQLTEAEKSLREFYRQLLNLSANESGFGGEYRELHSLNRYAGAGYDGKVFAFARWNSQQQWLIVSNFSATEGREFNLQLTPDLVEQWRLDKSEYTLHSRLGENKTFVLSVQGKSASVAIKLAPLESLVLQLNNY